MADQESELNALLKKQSDAIRAQQQSFLQTWADAFCDRDGAAIDSLCMVEQEKKNDEGAAACDRRRRYHLWMVKPVANVGYVG